MSERITRNTLETQIVAEVTLHSEHSKIETGVGFFDHMLTLFAKHANIGIVLFCKGDTHVDTHHTIEDCGIVLGRAIRQELKDCAGIKRYGHAYIPMDECLCRACVDISNRPYLVYHVTTEEYSEYEEFFRAFTFHAGFTLHIELLYGKNPHHKLESVFKAVARAVREAISPDGAITGIPSTKGVL